MKYTKWITYSICVLAAVAGCGGLFYSGLYRDSDFYRAVWQANDLVTLILIPIVLIANLRMIGGSRRWYLVWLGLMLYMFYNYAFYLFGAAFNDFFLVYALLFSLSQCGLIVGLYQVHSADINQLFRHDSPRTLIGIFLSAIILSLGFIEITQYVNFIVADKKPEIPTLILALDLSIVVPTAAIAAILLWRNNPWGKILGAMMLIKSATYGLVLISGSALIVIRGLGRLDPLLPFYVFVACGGCVFSWLLLKMVPSTSMSNRKHLIQTI
jgi:hypothetical protein